LEGLKLISCNNFELSSYTNIHHAKQATKSRIYYEEF
jgi:hypothetical protein